jgi:molecular chaperone Hsp33
MAIEYKSENDKWLKCISSSGTIRAVAVTVTDIANFMIDRHQTSAIGNIAQSEALVASLILASYSKGEEKINLNIHGSGWCQQAIFDANAEAEVRGYIRERPQEEVHLAKGVGPWGIGLMSVLRTKHDDAQPYIGTVPLLTGRLPKDLTFYWHQSEQVQSAVGIDVFWDEGKITLAEGFLIQALPGASAQDIQFIEDHLKKLHQFGSDSTLRGSPVNLLAYLMADQGFNVIEEKQITFKCHCSLERVKRSLMLVGPEEMQSMIDDKKDIDISCDFCSEKYIFDTEMIRTLLNKGN